MILVNELNKREFKVLEVLRKYKNGISTMLLIQKTEMTRPQNEIVTLRKKGYNIQTMYKTNEKTKKFFGVYKLLNEPGENDPGESEL
jgi:hypothetical protein